MIIEKLTAADKILMITVLIIPLLLWAYPVINAYQNEQEFEAFIQYKQQMIATVDLSKDGIYSFTFDDHISEYQIEDRQIRLLPMVSDLCPNSICSNSGWIKNPGQVIVCIPNQLIVKIQGKDLYPKEIDAVT